MIQIGKRLRVARERVGLSQQYVSEQIGVSRATLVNWEQGRHMPGLLQFRELLTLYTASPYEILYGTSRMRLSDEEKAELWQLAARASVNLRMKISLALTVLTIED